MSPQRCLSFLEAVVTRATYFTGALSLSPFYYVRFTSASNLSRLHVSGYRLTSCQATQNENTGSRLQLPVGGTFFQADRLSFGDAGGVKAISRGLSASDTPGKDATKRDRPRQGSQRRSPRFALRPLRGRIRGRASSSGGIAGAQPPANGCHPYPGEMQQPLGKLPVGNRWYNERFPIE